MAENEHISRAAGNGAPAQIRPADRSGSGDTRPVVFYDGGCPLCRREIAHYRRLRGAADLRWVDVVGEPDNLEKFGLSVEAAMQELHPEQLLVLGETGWATSVAAAGEQAELIKGRPGEALQWYFHDQVRAWAEREQQTVFWFEAFDENWKGGDDPAEVEKHWGLFRADTLGHALAYAGRMAGLGGAAAAPGLALMGLGAPHWTMLAAAAVALAMVM